MSSIQLRIDPSNGKPYTHDSFIQTYSDGQAIWDNAEVWNAPDGVLRIRTVPVSKPVEQETHTVQSNCPSMPSWEENDFPSIGTHPHPPTVSVNTDGTHYSRIVTPDEKSMSPEAPEFMPGAGNHLTIKYSETEPSSNEDFETLPSALWNGTEEFVQPLTDDENGVVDWNKMIKTWSKEQWTEFGIKFFYGYIQQSSILMGRMTMPQDSFESDEQTDEPADEGPIGAWGDE